MRARTRPRSRPISQASERAADAMQERYAGKLAALADGGKGGAALAKAVRELRGVERPHGPHRVLCEPALRRRHVRSRRGRNSSATFRRRSPPSPPSFCSSRSSSTGSTTRVLEAAMADPELGHYRPWIEDLRKEKPYQLEDKIEQLFHEKAVTARGAWNRLFNETMTALRFDVEGEKLSARADAQSPAAIRTRRSAARLRRSARATPSRTMCGCSR